MLSFVLPLKIDFNGDDVQANNLKNDLLFLLYSYKSMGRKSGLIRYHLFAFYIW